MTHQLTVPRESALLLMSALNAAICSIDPIATPSHSKAIYFLHKFHQEIHNLCLLSSKVESITVVTVTQDSSTSAPQ
jgi:hypothetical protein